MLVKDFKQNWDSRIFLRSLLLCLIASGFLAGLLAGLEIFDVRAQDEGPVCPPGFYWNRMSGVGCVQEDCAEAGGRYTYTSECICADESLKSCTSPVDYSNFDQESCGIFCPGSHLVACVPPEDLCPGEVAPTFAPAEVEPTVPFVFPEEPPDFGSGLGEQVRHFIMGGHPEPPTPGRAAVAAALGTSMVGVLTFAQWLSQRTTSASKSLGSQRSGSAGSQQAETADWQDARAAGGELVDNISNVIDKWPGGGEEEPPRAPAGASKPDDIPRARESRPVDGPAVDLHSAVFYGAEALVILKEMGKLPADTALSYRPLLGWHNLAQFAGPHEDGRSREITLPSGRQVIVAEVEGVGFEGLDTSSGPMEVEFNEKFTLTARLVQQAQEDILEAPTQLRPAVQPKLEPPDLEAPTISRKDLAAGDDQGSPDEEVDDGDQTEDGQS